MSNWLAYPRDQRPRASTVAGRAAVSPIAPGGYEATLPMPWFSRFDAPIKPAGRLPLRTLAEARGFIRQLPTTEQMRIEWVSAAALLAEAAERGGAHISIARTAVARALSRSEVYSR